MQLGQLEEINYQNVDFAPSAPSRFANWPTKEKPDGSYKVVGLWLVLGQSLITTER